MSGDFTPELQTELLEDFYAECDELLSGIRKSLAHLEHAGATDPPDSAALESIYRSIHTLKGIAGIVGLRAAEQLAHGTEGLLRSLSRGESAWSEHSLDLLAGAVQRLDQLVAAHRLNQPPPDTESLVAQLRQYGTPAGTRGEIAPASSTPSPGRALAAGAGPDADGNNPQGRWLAIFSPSAELDRRGVNINAVRERLSALGPIVRAAPSVQPGGAMQFEFLLAVPEPPSDVEGWARDGIQFRPAVAGQSEPEPAPDSRPQSEPAPGLATAPSHIVRVELSRLDELMRIVGEMVIHRSRLEERIHQLNGGQSGLQEVNLSLGRSLRELREAITRVRLVPVAEIFTRLPFAVRDLGRESGKKVRLALEGEDTEIDKYVVERLKEPLLHLVRNAVSHGVESPAERLAAGKREEAVIRLRAATDGQWATIEIHDDGSGIDPRTIAARAASLGEPISNSPTEAELLDVLCRPGFSTRDEADLAAGRGVGMAVVHNTIRELGGTLSLRTQPGQWTSFRLRLPLTLSIAETFLVSAAGQLCAIPQGFVEEIVLLAATDVRTIQQVEVVSYRDGVLPLVRLRALFRTEPSTVAQVPMLILSTERGLCGLVVDRVHGQREVVVRSMHDPLLQVPGVAGATELGDGRPVLILDPVDLTSGAVRPRTSPRPPVPSRAAPTGAFATAS